MSILKVNPVYVLFLLVHVSQIYMNYLEGFVAEEFIVLGEGSCKPQCSICGKDFSKKSDVKRHILSLHSGVQQQVVCNLCGKTLKNKESLGCHKRNSHGIYRDNQPYSLL